MIKRAFPEIKIFAVLRNPVERAFSHYNMERYKTGKEKRSLRQIVREEPDNEIIGRGFYYKQLRPFTDLFRDDQIKICLFDDMKNDPMSFFRDLFAFVGADASFIPPVVNKKVNKSRKTRYLFIPRSIRTMRTSLENLELQFLVRFLHRVGFVKWIRTLNSRYNQGVHNYKMPDDEKRLLQELYVKDIEQLERLVRRDLRKWKE